MKSVFFCNRFFENTTGTSTPGRQFEKLTLVSAMKLVFFSVICTIYLAFLVTCSSELPLCTDRSVQLQPCAHNDSYCGDWDIVARKYTPNNCRYREVSNEDALKCVGNRTIACIGDSIVRDMCIGLAMYLSGETVMEGPDYKYDRRAEILSHFTNASKIGMFKSWKRNRLNYNGLLFPRTDRSHPEWEWQIQVWELHSTEYQGDHRVEDVLENKMAHQVPALALRTIDLAFWSHGLHDLPDWAVAHYGESYFHTIVKQWLKVREEVPTPVVWTSINPHCLALDPLAKRAAQNRVLSPFIKQVPIQILHCRHHIHTAVSPHPYSLSGVPCNAGR